MKMTETISKNDSKSMDTDALTETFSIKSIRQ